MSKEKKVFSDGADVAHLWAHQSQSEARTPSSNFYFRGKSIYSYGRHFEIARILEEKVVIMTNQSYSNTTSKHVHYVRMAIPYDVKVITVPYIHGKKSEDSWFFSSETPKNIEYFAATVNELVEKQKKARKIDYTKNILNTLKAFRDYVEYFSLKKEVPKYYKFMLEYDGDGDEDVAEFMREQFGVVANKKLKERKAKERKLKKEQAAKIQEWLEGSHGKNEISCYTGDKVLLRLVERGGEKFVQTSKGVEVTAESAMKLYLGVCIIRKNRTLSEEVIEKFLEKNNLTNIDNWTVNKVTKDGDIIAGCHKIHYSEIERFGKKYNWETEAN